MQELLFSITYPPIPITQVGPISLSLHGVFAAVGFYFGANHALNCQKRMVLTVNYFRGTYVGYFWCDTWARFFTIQLNGMLTQIMDLMISSLLLEAIQLWVAWRVE